MTAKGELAAIITILKTSHARLGEIKDDLTKANIGSKRLTRTEKDHLTYVTAAIADAQTELYPIIEGMQDTLNGLQQGDGTTPPV